MIPIYRSDGEWVAIYTEGNVYNVDGEWLGFTMGRELYDPLGEFVGFLSDDKRLLRSRAEPRDKNRLTPPPRPSRPRFPPSMPLAPLLRALPYQLIDMFEEYPNRFLYVSETRPDMD
jgi:hypothetical protein